MKKKINKKLARNAIRARKAVKKRENEQNNSKQRKRTATRIASFIGCLLLVSALIVPCFADTYTPPYGDAVAIFTNSLDPRANNLAYKLLIDYYNSFGNSRFFTRKTLVSGEMDLNYLYKDFTFLNTQWSSSDGTFRSSMPIEYFVSVGYSTEDSYVLDTYDYYVYGSNATLTLTISKGVSYADGTLLVQFNVGSSPNTTFACVYDLAFDSVSITGTIRSVSFGGLVISADEFYDVSIAFVPTDLSENIPLSMFVQSLFDNNYSSATYYNFVYSPSDFYKGFSASYNLGYSDGERNVYQSAYEQGFSAGENSPSVQNRIDEAYQNGLSSSDGFNEGYYEALRQVESGDFGKNLLGATLNTPLEALANFNIVSWTTVNGRTINISIMTVLSGIIGLCLFIWFLKMFAGG